ncbi:MAG: TetR family transcriptional regulator C-terminal domain-containing protein [Clostridia bacterium]|nr:TetR family transcriptional regulator C-terminal domain-containing protein [Clostridia bacterium]
MQTTARRRKPSNENDKRILKTKASIREALFRIIETKSIDKVTVTEIVNEACINRSTFYFYYEDINDMMKQIQDEIYEKFYEEMIIPDTELSSPEQFRRYVRRFLQFCKDNKEICRFVTNNGCNNDLFTKIRREVEKVIPNSMTVYAETDSRYYLTTFAVSGILYSILEWFYNGMKIEPEDMADFLASVYVFGSLKTKVTPRMSFRRNKDRGCDETK